VTSIKMHHRTSTPLSWLSMRLELPYASSETRCSISERVPQPCGLRMPNAGRTSKREPRFMTSLNILTAGRRLEPKDWANGFYGHGSLSRKEGRLICVPVFPLRSLSFALTMKRKLMGCTFYKKRRASRLTELWTLHLHYWFSQPKTTLFK